MPFKKKPVVKVGKGDWTVEVPRPPNHSTHVVLTMDKELKDNGKPKTATLPIQDFGCFRGVSGHFSYIRMNNKRKLLEKYKGKWYWDGYRVDDIDKLKNE